MNLYEKLVEVRKSCKYLKKDNQGHQYQYVSSSQTLGTLREAMDKMGLILAPKVINHDVKETVEKKIFNGNEKTSRSYFTELEMEFVWINAEKPEEQLVVPFYAQGVDNAEKGVGKALTYGEKYFLLKFFNIATDKDDPDSFQKKAESNREYNPSGDIAKINGCRTLDELHAIWIGLSKDGQHNLSVQQAKDLMKNKIIASQQNAQSQNVSPEKVKYIQTLYGKTNIKDREIRLQDISARLGIEKPKSTNDLTVSQADSLITSLKETVRAIEDRNQMARDCDASECDIY